MKAVKKKKVKPITRVSKKVSKKASKELTPKEARFVLEYLVDLDVERAANVAGFSPSMAHTKAFMWVRDGKTKPHVFNAIRKQQAKLIRKTEVTQERIVTEYAKLGFLDPSRFYDSDGELIPVPDLPKEVAATLTEINVLTSINPDGDSIDTLKKIKWSDKKGALDSLSRHLGMFIDKHELTGKDGSKLFPELSDADLDDRIAAMTAEKA